MRCSYLLVTDSYYMNYQVCIIFRSHHVQSVHFPLTALNIFTVLYRQNQFYVSRSSSLPSPLRTTALQVHIRAEINKIKRVPFFFYKFRNTITPRAFAKNQHSILNGLKLRTYLQFFVLP